MRPLAQRYVRHFDNGVRPPKREVIQFLLNDSGFQRAWSEHRKHLRIEKWLTEPQQMQPVPAARTWSTPPIESVGGLADWLGLRIADLEWLADLKGLTSRRCDPRLEHYHYRILEKKSGGLRLIESPKERLKHVQQQILSGILDSVPAHPVAHGFVRGRSIRTFAAPHIGRAVLLRMDLQDFFPSFAARRIQAFFRTIGYPEAVADLLGGLCTNSVRIDSLDRPKSEVPPSLWQEARHLYGRPHLPQGAPTSPALANLCCYRLDCRLSGLARSASVEYTRYADDLAFSGGFEFARKTERFAASAAAILLDSGFAVNHHKTRIMSQGARQRLAGLVVNQHLNIARPEVDRLKAVLTNCIRNGPESQNHDKHPAFRAHLEGRVGFVETVNPARGHRLRELLDRVQW